MAAPPIPPIRLGPTGTGLAVEELQRPASRGLADRCEVTALTDSFAEQSRWFADFCAKPAGWCPARAGSPARRCDSGRSTAARAPHRPDPAALRRHRARTVPCRPPAARSTHRRTHSSSDATTYPTAFRGIDNGYRADRRRQCPAVRAAAGRQRRAERGQRDGRPVGSRLRGTDGRTGARPPARREPGTAAAAPRLDRAVRRAARTTHQQFGDFRRMNDPQRGARLAVPAVATSPRR